VTTAILIVILELNKMADEKPYQGQRHRHPESHEGKYAVCCQRLYRYQAEITALMHAGSRDTVHISASSRIAQPVI
jgi:hypothetical protein